MKGMQIIPLEITYLLQREKQIFTVERTTLTE